MEINEIYEDALSLAELACNAKEKIRSLLASGKIDDADKLRISIMNLGHYRRLKSSIIKRLNRMRLRIKIDTREKKEELKND